MLNREQKNCASVTAFLPIAAERTASAAPLHLVTHTPHQEMFQIKNCRSYCVIYFVTYQPDCIIYRMGHKSLDNSNLP
jgi:hypothetical protein